MPENTLAPDATAARYCPSCGEAAGTADKFCEQCGHALDDATAAASNGTPAADQEGHAEGPAATADHRTPAAGQEGYGEGPADAADPGSLADSPGRMSAGGTSDGGSDGAGSTTVGGSARDAARTAGGAAGDTAAAAGGSSARQAPPKVVSAVAGLPCECGAGHADADGYCDSCGSLVRSPNEQVISTARAGAVVSDPGLVHRINQDAGAVGDTPALTYGVVCDGVSSAPRSDIAARAAVAAVADALHDSLTGADPDTIRAALTAAVAAAAAAAAGTAGTDPLEQSPACTLVAAVLDPHGTVHTANVGDSRAYWVPDDGDTAQLTVDDSWATEAIKQGMPPAQAWADSRSHALTGWLGADAGPVRPTLASLPLAGPGIVVVCSDGLWNYLTETDAFGARVRAAGVTDLAAAAGNLVDFARAEGGHDNITVALLRHEHNEEGRPA
jgi:serine/threonine protein phosphatase PrpC